MECEEAFKIKHQKHRPKIERGRDGIISRIAEERLIRMHYVPVKIVKIKLMNENNQRNERRKGNWELMEDTQTAGQTNQKKYTEVGRFWKALAICTSELS